MKSKQETHIYSKKFPHYLIIILISIVGILAYHQSLLKGSFVFDDKALVIDNALIKDFSYIKEIFTTHLFHGSGGYSNFYRPMQSLSLMLDYHLWRLNPFGYHLSNVLTHIFNAVLVYFFIYLVSKKQGIAVITTLLFCVQTVLSWPVNYVASRADLLVAFFLLIALVSYILYMELNKHSILFYLLSLACFILAILSKEVALILPFVLLLYLWCFPKRRTEHGKKSVPNLIWVFFIIMGVYILLRSTVLNFAGDKFLETTTGNVPLYIRLLTASKVFMIYLRLLVFPVGLHMEWDILPATSFFQDEVFLSIVGLFVIGGFTYFLSRTSKLKFFAISWFFIMLLPYSNILPLAYFMGESWLYIPSIGFFALVSMYLFELGRRSRPWFFIVTCAVISMVVFYSFLTFRRAEVWASPVKLYIEILRYSPDNAKARINLGVLLAESGSDEEAIKRYKEASELAPSDSGVHGNLGDVYARKGMHDMALEEFKKAVERDPKDHVAHMNIGIIYKKKGEFEKAMEEYKKALELNPNYPLTYNNIGNIYLEKGQYDEAIRFYKQAIGLNPDIATFYGNLGKALEKKGLLQEARESFEKALKLDPTNQDAIDGLKSFN